MKRFLPVLVALAAVACGTEQTTQPADIDPLFEISDAAHAGTAHFYWLPPMVPQPSLTGTFDGTLKPAVVICGIPNPAVPPISCQNPDAMWTFTRTSGPGSERVTVDANGQHYQLNWHTDDYKHPDFNSYRIRVLLGAMEIGFADVFIDVNAKEFRYLDQTIGLIDGSTLPIKFRIEGEMFDEAVFDVMLHSDAGGDLDVYLMDSRTGAMRNITQDPALDGTANWSPDGSKIIFASDRANPGVGIDIYTMNPDGTNVHLLKADGWQPEYSPDGTKIVFQRGWPPEPYPDPWGCPPPGSPGNEDDQCGREHDIWLMNADGTGEIQLTDTPNDFPYSRYPAFVYDLWEDWSPTWHPSGHWVTFGRARNTLEPGFKPNINCQDPQQSQQEWFRPGTQPWWNRTFHYCYFDVVSVDVTDLTGRYDPANEAWWDDHTHRHTYDVGVDHLGPRWSPDGNVLTVKRNADDGFILAYTPYVATVGDFPGPFDGSSGPFQALTPHWQDGEGNWQGTEDGNVSWSTVGSRVLFSSTRNGGVGIYGVEDWPQWLQLGASYPQAPIRVNSGELNDWARFRPGH